MANHEKTTASTKLKNLIPNMPYKGELTPLGENLKIREKFPGWEIERPEKLSFFIC